MTITEALKAEIAHREAEFETMIDAAIDLLRNAKDRDASTHLGHNLANRATDLAALAGKIDANKMLLRFVETEQQ